MQGERRAGAQVPLAGGCQHVVRRLPHERHELHRVGQVDRLGADVGLGVARAVPVEVVAAGPPAASVVLGDGDLEVAGPVGPLDATLPPTPVRDLLAASGATVFVLATDPGLIAVIRRAAEQHPLLRLG